MDAFRTIGDDANLYGRDSTARIVAVEFHGSDQIAEFYRRIDGSTERTMTRFRPWLLTDADGARDLAAKGSISELAGSFPLRYLVEFDHWSGFRAARDLLEDNNRAAHHYGNPIDQYLTITGRTLFKGMDFENLIRLQIDIETVGLRPDLPDSTVLAISISTNRGHREVLHQGEFSEQELLSRAGLHIQELDPDVIEGHNIFNFDIPFLLARAQRHGLDLTWGRDRSTVTLRSTRRFKAGARTIPFQNISIYGRHIIDTYQQIQRYDSAGELESYGLKAVIEALGLTRPGRVFLNAADMASLWEHDRERVIAYAIDDVLDVEVLSGLTTPTEFYQTQILPRSYQNVALGGTGEKINYLMTRAYLQTGHSLPLPEPSRPYPGGYSEVKKIGVFRPVVKCDVESLYPAIMLSEGIAPSRDHLSVYLELLKTLTERRLAAKRMAQSTNGSEQARWQGLQLSFKVLVNSFYGYLGYGRAIFNDFDAAERVTLRGQELIQRVAVDLEHEAAEPIEIDTDGIYFRPPNAVRDSDQEEEFVAALAARMPEGISLAHDGSYQGMLSLKTKNYALLTHDDRLVLKGSSLRSRRDERIFRRFLREAARRFIAGAHEDARELYFQIAGEIVTRQLSVEDIARWETVTEKTFTSDANRRLATAAGEERIGERVAVYQRTGGELARIEQYQNDEDVDYLLRRLRDMAQRFRVLFDDDTSFNHVFPILTSRTDLAQLRNAPLLRQASFFG